MSGHPSQIHHEMVTRTRIALILLKLGNFELSRYFHIRNQAQIIDAITKKLFPLEGLQLFLHLVKLFLETIHSIIKIQAFTWRRKWIIVNLFVENRSSMHHKRCENNNRLGQ